MMSCNRSAIKTLGYLFTDISKVPSCATNDFVALYETKLRLERKLMEALTAISTSNSNSDSFKSLLSRITQAEKEKKSVSNELTIQVQVDHSRTDGRTYYSTLCMHPKCYSTCHERCGLPYSTDNQKFLGCDGVGGTTCRTCNHSYQAHVHNYVVWVKDIRMETQFDTIKKAQYESSTSQLTDLQQQKKRIEAEIADFDKKKEENVRVLQETVEEFNKASMLSSFTRYLHDLIYILEQHKQEAPTPAQKEDYNTTIIKLKAYLKQVSK